MSSQPLQRESSYDDTSETEPVVTGGFTDMEDNVQLMRFPKVGIYVRASTNELIHSFQIEGTPYSAKRIRGNVYEVDLEVQGVTFLVVNGSEISIAPSYLFSELRKESMQIDADKVKSIIISKIERKLGIHFVKASLSPVDHDTNRIDYVPFSMNGSQPAGSLFFKINGEEIEILETVEA